MPLGKYAGDGDLLESISVSALGSLDKEPPQHHEEDLSTEGTKHGHGER